MLAIQLLVLMLLMVVITQRQVVPGFTGTVEAQLLLELMVVTVVWAGM